MNKEGQCTLSRDSDDMANFFTNVLRYLTENASSETRTGSSITIGTNIPSVYFKRAGQVMGSSAPFIVDSRFAAKTVQLTDFAHLDPVTMPVVIINAYEYRG
ncbi:MAG: hypothetical protein ACRDAP_11780, partial [Shewanella sp.]